MSAFDLSLAIRTGMAQKNVKQYSLAKKLDISQPALSMIVRRNDCRISVMRKIAECLNYSFHEFIELGTHELN